MGVFYSLQHHTVTGSVISQTATKQDRPRKGIMQILVLCLAVSASAVPQGINFGETASTTKKPDIGQRLGLLANSLGLDPTGANGQQGTSSTRIMTSSGAAPSSPMTSATTTPGEPGR